MASAKTQDVFSDDLNYELWAPTTKATLLEKGLWDVVENGIPPNPSKIPEVAAKMQPEELSKWRDLVAKDVEALQILQSSLTDSSFRKTLSASTAKEVWDLLQKGNEEAKLHRLEKVFEGLSMNEGEAIISYLDRVKQIVEQLRRLKIEKSDYLVIKKVLATLSGSYEAVVPVMEELLDLKNMTFKGLVDYFTKFESIPDETIHLMMKADRLRSMTQKKWCGVCNTNDHNREECYTGIYKLNKCDQCGEQGHKAKIWVIEAQKDEEEDTLVDYLLLAAKHLGDFTYDEGMWMIYGHASNHMTPYEKHFITLDRTHKTKLGLVDGTAIMVEGRGDVKIKMKEGKQKTISNVLFVPGLNRNLLSVRQMQSRGCSFTPGKRGECIVRDRTGKEFGDTTWDKRGLSLRLQVIEGNATS